MSARKREDRVARVAQPFAPIARRRGVSPKRFGRARVARVLDRVSGMGTVDDARVLAALRGAHALMSDPSSSCGLAALHRVCCDNPRLFGMCLRHLEAANPFDADLAKVGHAAPTARMTMCFIYEVAIARLARAVARSSPPIDA